MVLQVPTEIADLTSADKTGGIAEGEGLAPPEIADLTSADKISGIAVGEGLAPPEIADSRLPIKPAE